MDIAIEKTIDFVKQSLNNAESGHDWWHVNRVRKMAKHITGFERCNTLVVELASLLHDIADSKFYDGDEEIGPKLTLRHLELLHLDQKVVDHVVEIVKNVSFKGGNEQCAFDSIELKIVQDADRLDALGAIGIARTFNYGGYKNRQIYDPEILPNLNMSKEDYKKSTAPTINHFYEKLLLLKDRMHTEKAKEIAKERHEFLELYLKQFYMEWNCKF